MLLGTIFVSGSNTLVQNLDGKSLRFLPISQARNVLIVVLECKNLSALELILAHIADTLHNAM
jgi:hypothetical protein